MARLNSFIVSGISRKNADDYLLSCKINGRNRRFTARVIRQPIFGVTLPDEIVLLLRDNPQKSRRLVKIFKNYTDGADLEFPINLLETRPISVLKAA